MGKVYDIGLDDTPPPGEGPGFCRADRKWKGHPLGRVPCDRWERHPGLHHFEWFDFDGRHELNWADSVSG